MAAHKHEGPSTSLSVLGIVIDAIVSELWLPADKLQCLQALLGQWGDKKVCSCKELESLIGLLNHACKVVRSGRSFLQRMIDLHAVPPHQPYVRLNAGFRVDLAWWGTFLKSWNGTSFLPPPSFLPKTTFMTGASGSWGCGAWFSPAWFQLHWDSRAQPLSIANPYHLSMRSMGLLMAWLSGHMPVR